VIRPFISYEKIFTEKADLEKSYRTILEKTSERFAASKSESPTEFTHGLDSLGKAGECCLEIRRKIVALEKVSVDHEDAKKRDIKCREGVLAELRKLKLKPKVKQAQQGKRQARSRPQAQRAGRGVFLNCIGLVLEMGLPLRGQL
jgi:hypothetical protein